MGTPRRLVLMVEQLATQQQSAVKETMGPSKAVAFDQAGLPTKAAIGFAAAQGVPVEPLQVRQTAKGEYVCAVKQEKGQSAAAVLTQHLPGLIDKLSFPKAMQWNDTGVRFARPVRWLVALCGGKILPIEFAGVKAGQISHGHRVMEAHTSVASKGFPGESIQQYLKETERHGVIVDQERRRRDDRRAAVRPCEVGAGTSPSGHGSTRTSRLYGRVSPIRSSVHSNPTISRFPKRC